MPVDLTKETSVKEKAGMIQPSDIIMEIHIFQVMEAAVQNTIFSLTPLK